MIDWVSIVRHSRRRFSNYVGTRAPIRMKKRRRTPNPIPIAAPTVTSAAHSPQDDRHQYTCCCTHVSLFSSQFNSVFRCFHSQRRVSFRPMNTMNQMLNNSEAISGNGIMAGFFFLLLLSTKTFPKWVWWKEKQQPKNAEFKSFKKENFWDYTFQLCFIVFCLR